MMNAKNEAKILFEKLYAPLGYQFRNYIVEYLVHGQFRHTVLQINTPPGGTDAEAVRSVRDFIRERYNGDVYVVVEVLGSYTLNEMWDIAQDSIPLDESKARKLYFDPVKAGFRKPRKKGRRK